MAELLDEGLAYVQISGRLGIRLDEVKTAAKLGRRPDHGTPERGYFGCRCEACSEAIRNDPLVLQVGELRKQGLSYPNIAQQLRVPVHHAERAGRASGVKKPIVHRTPTRLRTDIAKDRLSTNGLGKAHAHGTPNRWRSGCRCEACVAAIRKDPLVIQVGELRKTGLKYKEIAERLGISVSRAHQSGIAAGFSGPVKVARSAAPPQCSWEECDSPAQNGDRCPFHQDWAARGFDPDNPATTDDFPSAMRAAITLKAVELRLAGQTFPQVGRRLGISRHLAEKVCRNAGLTDVLNREEALAAAAGLWRQGADWHLVTFAGELVREGLTTPEITERLGVSRASAINACTLSDALSTVHGVPAKWHSGCRCDTCLEAMRNDPFITAVAEQRSRNVPYKDIVADLGTTLSRAQRAAKEAQDCGLVGNIRFIREAAAKSAEQKSIPVDGFTPEAWAELVDAVGNLRESGLRNAAIGRRLGVSTAVATHAGRMVGKVVVPAEQTAPLADLERLSEFAVHGDEPVWGIPMETYVQMTSQEEVSPEARVRTPEEWAGLVQTVGELRQAGLSIKKISLRLGIPPGTALDACEESSFDGIPARPAHGTKNRWQTGCNCVLCTEGKEADPLIAAVRELRGERKSYPEIARILGVSAKLAWQAGKDAGLTGYPERPSDEAPVVAVGTPEEWADLVQTVGELRKAGLSVKKISLRLGIPPGTVLAASEESSFDGNPARPAHGTKARWRSCSCVLCTEGKEADPLITAVRELRGEEKSYSEISRLLGVSHQRAWEAGRDAGLVAGRLKRATVEPSLREREAAQRAADRARANANSQPWTEADERKVLGSDLPVKELAVMLGRTPTAIRNRRRELSSNGGMPRTNRRQVRPWTQEEDQVVMREDLNLQEKADKLGRSYAAVSGRRVILRKAAGVTPTKQKGRPWTPEDLATARRDDLTVKELAAMLGRTTASVYATRHRP